MKNFFVPLFLLLCFAARADQQKPVRLSVVSNELDSIGGTITLTLTYLFYDTIAYSDSLALDLPFDDWQVVSVGNLSGSTFLPGDSAFRTIIIAHPVDSIPFYAQTIKFNSYGLIEGIASRPRVATTTANVYFTPYNTVEIWNSVEFANLQRYWFSDPGQYKTRVYVHPDSIPVTNIPDWFVPSERWQEDFQVAFVEGLGYAIPMLATHPDSLMDYIDSSRADGCGATYRRFQGTVSGNVFTIFQIPTGGAITALAGLKVEIWEHDDAFLSIKLAEGELDAQGNFSIWVNTCQSSIFEGSNCEIFLKIVAKNDQYDIKGFTSCWPWMPAKVHSTQLHSWPYNNGDPMNLNMGSEFVWEESHKAVYLARNAYRFFNDSYDGWDLPIHLNLQTDLPNGSFFLPNSYGGVPAATALYAMATQPYILPYMTLGCAVSGFNFNSVVYTPTIYVWDGETDGENLVYHEFGHFVMWHLNDKKWTDLFTGTFAAHDPYTESNIRIAWNEGWSDAFSMMVDAHHRNLDNEFAFWDAIDEMDYENREYTPGLDEDEQPIFVDDVNFGPGSEFFIACALYDLWDGPSKINNFPPDRYTDANDDQIAAPNRWRNGEFDDVELSFQEIANVIRYGTLDEALSNDVNVISSVQSYYYNLIKDKSCDDARRIKKVFDQNRVVGIRGNFPDADYEGFSSDGIWRTREIENSGGSSFDYFFKFDLNTLDNALPVYNLGSSTNNVEYANISDRMQINTGCSLYFNAVGAQFYADNNGTPDDEMLYVTVCNHVNNSGLMHVGHDANNAAHRNVAEVKFMAGGTLTLNAGSTLRVKPHSRVIFEPGSSFVYNGGTIVLEGSDSYIEIKGAFHIGDHATFTFTGDGHVILQTPYDSPSFTVGTNSKFVLDGADKNDLVLVTNGWMCAPPDALAEFKITNGKVECDYNGGLNLGCPCTVQNVLITRRSDIVGGGVHRGLNIYNQQTTGTSAANISSVEIEHGWRGFVAIPWDVIHEVSDVYVHDCEEALLTINAGITMTDVHLAHNRLGWQAFNMTLPSRATNLRIENTKEAGINYHGGGSSPLYLYSPVISTNGFSINTDGVQIWGPTQAFVHCGTVDNNAKDGFFIGAGSALILSPLSPDKPFGSTSILNNGYAGVELRAAYDLQASKGHNWFNNNAYEIKGRIFNQVYCPSLSLYATNNQWGPSPTHQPVDGVDYDLQFLCNSGTSTLIQHGYVLDFAPSLYAPCPRSMTPREVMPCASCRHIAFAGETKSLNQWVYDADQLISLEPAAENSKAFDALYHIIKLDGAVWNAEEESFVRKAYRLIGQAYGNSIYTKELMAPDSAGLDSNVVYYERYKEINERKLIDPVLSFDVIMKEYDNAISGAAAHSLSRDFDSSETALSELQSDIALLKSVRDQWACVNEALKLLANGAIPNHEVADYIQTCGGGYRMVDGDSSIYGDSRVPQITMYPNPSYGTVVVNAHGLPGNDACIEVYDNLGKRCYKAVYGVTKGGFIQQINLRGFTPGIYQVKVTSGDAIETDKLFLLNR